MVKSLKGKKNYSKFHLDNTAFAFKSLTPVPPSRKEGAILKSDFLKRKYLIFPTIFCGLLIKYKPIILNANAVLR